MYHHSSTLLTVNCYQLNLCGRFLRLEQEKEDEENEKEEAEEEEGEKDEEEG